MSIKTRVCLTRYGRILSGLETKSPKGQVALSPFRFQSRGFLLMPFKTLFSRNPKEIEEKSKLSPESIHGEKILFEGNSVLTVRSMFAAGSVNTMYWSWHLANCYIYQDVIVSGIDLGGQPFWSFFGFAGTGLLFYCNYEYAGHTAYQVYETADKERIGFQMYNIFGNPGRKIEANIGNVRAANMGKSNWSSGSDSFVALRIVGVSNNVLLDKDGIFFANGRLKSLLRAGGDGTAGSKQPIHIKPESAKKGTWAHIKNEEKKHQRKYIKDLEK